MNKKISSFFKFLLLSVLCVGASILLVWPFWKFSTGYPKVYTIVVLSLLGLFLLYLIINKIRKTEIIKTITFFVNFLIIAAGIVFSVKFVFLEKKLLSLFIFLATIFVTILSNLLINRLHHE